MTTGNASANLDKELKNLKEQIEQKHGKSTEELYAEREKRVRQAINLDKPDRVPIMMHSDPSEHTDVRRSAAYYDPVNFDPKDGITTSLIPIDRPLWPYESWINIKEMPPKRLDHMQQQSLYTWRNMDHKKLTNPELLLKGMGVETEEELKAYIAPIIPTIVVELIKYLQIFNDERHIYELRPMIYGYWG